MSDDQHIATINSNNTTITTHLAGNRPVTLTYKEFSSLLKDAAIIDLKAKYENDVNQQNKYAVRE